jgi:hypothetical protein
MASMKKKIGERKITLSSGERALLESWAANDADELRAKRAQAILYTARGDMVDTVAAILEADPRSIELWITRFLLHGPAGLDPGLTG